MMKSSNSEEENVDLHYQMCKKIAQLAKVIYHLHSKNEDHEYEIKDITSAYEEQIEEMSSDANAKIREFRHKILQSDISLEQIKQDHIIEREEAFRKFEAFKQTTKEREVSLRVNYEQQVESLTKELEAVKGSLNEKTKNFLETVTNIEAKQAKDLEAARKQYELDIQNMRSSLFNKEVAEAQQSLEKSWRAQIDSLRENLTGKISSLNADKLRLERDVSESNSKLSAISQQLNIYQDLNSDQEKTIYSLNKEIIEFKARESHNLSEISEYKEKAFNLEAKLSSKEQEIERLSAELDAFKQQLNNSEFENEQLEKKMIREIKELETLLKERVSQLEATINENEVQLHHSQAAYQKLTSQHNELKAERDKLLAEKEEKENKLTALNSEKESLFNSSQSEVSSLTAHLEKLRLDSELTQKALETEKMKLQLSLDEANAQSQKTINELNRTIIETEMRLRGEIDAQQRQNAETLAQRSRDHLQELTTLEQKLDTQYTSEINMLNEQHRTKTLEYERAVAELKNSISELQQIIEQKNSEINNLVTHSQQLKQLETNLGAELLKTIEDLKKTIAANKEKAAKELEFSLRELTEQLNAKWTVIVEQNDRVTKKTLANQLEREKKLLADLQSSKDSVIENLNGQRLQLEDRVWHLQQEIERARQASAVQELKYNEEQMEVLRQKHKQDLKEQEDRLNQKFVAEREKMEEFFSREMSAANAKYNQNAENIKNDNYREKLMLMQELAALRDQLEHKRQELSNVISNHADEMAIMENRHRHIVQNLNANIEGLNENLTSKQDKIAKFTKDQQRLEHLLSKTQKELEAKGEELIEVRKEANKQMKEREKQLNSEWRNRISQMEQDNLDEMNKQHTEHTKLQELLQEQIEKLQSQITFWENKYEHREPRPEDMELISRLTAECQEYRKKLQHLKDEMKFYKLELVNREETYNKIFGTSPKVGVMDPLNSNKRRSLASSSTSAISSKTTSLPPLSPQGGSPRMVLSINSTTSLKGMPP